MKNGGYIIVDLGGVNMEYDKPTKIEGIYNKIKGGTKPLLFSGIVIDGVKHRDRFVSPEINGNSYTVPITDATFASGAASMTTKKWLQVSNNDTVTAKHSEA